MILKKGEKSKIHVTIDSKGKSGKITKTVTIITNDPNPQRSTITLNVQGTVEKKEDPTQQNQNQSPPQH
jgi:hypothetical protein